jgi:hypothetical protein
VSVDYFGNRFFTARYFTGGYYGPRDVVEPPKYSVLSYIPQRDRESESFYYLRVASLGRSFDSASVSIALTLNLEGISSETAEVIPALVVQGASNGSDESTVNVKLRNTRVRNALHMMMLMELAT